MIKRLALLTLGVAVLHVSAAGAQQCVPGATLTPEQVARRQEGVRAARTINNLEANQPGSASKKYLSQGELPSSPFAATQTGAAAAFLEKLNFAPGAELMPGWELTLDVTATGYWFSIRDKTDPCGFTLISNHNGLILQAQPLR
ncbi:MAG TPA: hypothetical protein VFK57_22840 [Vicinamibacterales bacterium]|nr:hypothetical protein [Vicinamibacterales bacterium]